MLDQYLEENIQNKFKILHLLEIQSESSRHLADLLKISVPSINALVEEMNDVLCEAHIEKGKGHYRLLRSSAYDELTQIHRFCKDSGVLACMRFLLTNETHHSFSYFIAQSFYTRSSAYRLRERCLTYLHKVKLDVNNNCVVGEEYRIRYLMALLSYRYGIDCMKITAMDHRIARRFLLASNPHITIDFLKAFYPRYGYFEELLILAFKRQDHDVSFAISPTFDKFRTLRFYSLLEKDVFKHLSKACNLNFTKSDIDYIYLAGLSTNNTAYTHLFTRNDVILISHIIFDDQDFKDLLHRFTTIFSEDITKSYNFRIMLVYLFRKVNYGLQGIIPESHYYPEAKRSAATLMIYKRIEKIFDDWNKDHRFETAFYEKTIFKLSIEIAGIMKNIMPRVKVILITDQISDMLKNRVAIERQFSSQRIELITHVLTTTDMKQLETIKDAVIVLPKSLIGSVNSLSPISFSSTLIPITIEMTENDLLTIDEAISNYENKIFNAFLKQTKTSS